MNKELGGYFEVKRGHSCSVYQWLFEVVRKRHDEANMRGTSFSRGGGGKHPKSKGWNDQVEIVAKMKNVLMLWNRRKRVWKMYGCKREGKAKHRNYLGQNVSGDRKLL